MRSLIALVGCALLASCAGSPEGSLGDGLSSAAGRSAAALDPRTGSGGPQPTAYPTTGAGLTPTSHAASRPASAGPTTSPLPGELLFTRYPGRLTGAELPLIVYLPPGYDWTPGLMPAIYLLHGIGYDERQWLDLGLHRLVEPQFASGRWQPMLLIMPLMPDPLLSSSDGGPDSYEAEFLNGLVPYVERNFRVDPRRSALAGISRGGVWALEIALRHPDSFTGVAALSPALHMNFPRPRYDPSWIASEATSFPAVIYLDAGDREPRTRAAVQLFSELLVDRGVIHTLNLGEGGHNQDYWGSVALPALSALVEGFPNR